MRSRVAFWLCRLSSLLCTLSTAPCINTSCTQRVLVLTPPWARSPSGRGLLVCLGCSHPRRHSTALRTQRPNKQKPSYQPLGTKQSLLGAAFRLQTLSPHRSTNALRLRDAFRPGSATRRIQLSVSWPDMFAHMAVDFPCLLATSPSCPSTPQFLTQIASLHQIFRKRPRRGLSRARPGYREPRDDAIGARVPFFCCLRQHAAVRNAMRD